MILRCVVSALGSSFVLFKMIEPIVTNPDPKSSSVRSLLIGAEWMGINDGLQIEWNHILLAEYVGVNDSEIEPYFVTRTKNAECVPFGVEFIQLW